MRSSNRIIYSFHRIFFFSSSSVKQLSCIQTTYTHWTDLEFWQRQMASSLFMFILCLIWLSVDRPVLHFVTVYIPFLVPHCTVDFDTFFGPQHLFTFHSFCTLHSFISPVFFCTQTSIRFLFSLALRHSFSYVCVLIYLLLFVVLLLPPFRCVTFKCKNRRLMSQIELVTFRRRQLVWMLHVHMVQSFIVSNLLCCTSQNNWILFVHWYLSCFDFNRKTTFSQRISYLRSSKFIR